MIIRNKEQLATSPLRRKALEIIESGILQVLPNTIMKSALSFNRVSRNLVVNHDTRKLTGRLFVIGGGKASGLMAQTLEKIVGPGIITAGLVVEKEASTEFTTTDIQVVQAGHPFPDQRGVDAVCDLLGLKQKYSIGRDDTVLCLLSGGGSALMPYPIEGISLSDKQAVTQLLLSCGADIFEINSVRKHLSGTKGGRLAQYFAPAQVISLILSDVVGNDLSVIASGPTFPDPSTFEEASTILGKYDLLKRIPATVRLVLEKGCRGDIRETPKSLDNAHNYIIGDVRIALEAMAEKARFLGFKPLIISSGQTGDTAVLAAQRAQEILNGSYSGYNALLLGGETTPTLPMKHGNGGRNQHYAACTLSEFRDYKGDWVLTSIGTDGSDYLPDIAGAIVDNETLPSLKVKDSELQNCLECYDSNRVLDKAGNSLILTGNTHTNVGDTILYLLPR
jgi:glycerate 2-kinase